MLSKEILKQVRQIELRTRHLVNDVFSGEYHSVFKGRGMEFSEVREYQYGDDIRAIDWNVTARYAHPYVKIHEEERELNVMLVVDASRSAAFGSQGKFKNEIAAEICALLAFSAIKNNDKVGLLIFTDQVEKFIPPRKGKSHTLRVIREVLYFQPQSPRTNIKSGLEFLLKGLKRRAIVFLVSDFDDANFSKPLRVLNKKHDVIAISLADRRDKILPQIGLLNLKDAETGAEVWVDTTDKAFLERYAETVEQQRQNLRSMARGMKLDLIEIDTAASYVDPLVEFFKMREKRYR
ncbi:MAG: DUF58 domain-containing protein [Candidatus Marinimicrobia bacterium]|jgi:uncharacterized protein (DUF58 family)|nr:DUF58 domain-containing protein [Candidatus Neomarinimicrobiota bacterium]MCK9559750.1 DUF58 domain-containing protein [Candidatus Neomarinimicrobiota bacterium]MDD5061348.1 DUF58 domain-containing protein [Candidatus Neomarinimicrobiota bacterium]